MRAATVSARRCLLFVPGNRPERFAKARATGADMVCIDLEDAVAPAQKTQARADALAFAATLAADQGSAGFELVIRINALNSIEGQTDLAAISALPVINFLIMLPKSEDPLQIRAAQAQLTRVDTDLHSRTGLIALIESAIGIERAFELAACDGVQMLMLGGADYCAELGARMDQISLAYPRARLAAAAAHRALTAIDVPYLSLDDDAGLRAETELVAGMGIACKSAIHPKQVSVIQDALCPDPQALSWAQRVLAAMQASPHAAIQLDGKLVDRPIVLSAERILARAGRSA
jgi:citrate lyase beta subunit